MDIVIDFDGTVVTHIFPNIDHAHGQSASKGEIEAGALHRKNIKFLEHCIAEEGEQT